MTEGVGGGGGIGPGQFFQKIIVNFFFEQYDIGIVTFGFNRTSLSLLKTKSDE